MTQSAKIRLKTTHTSNDALIADLRKHFITTESAAVLSVKLINAKSVDKLGKSVDEMLI